MLQQRQTSSSKFTSNTLGANDNMGQWKGLDSLVAASSTASGTTPLVNHDDDWGLGGFASATATTATPTPKPAAGTELLWDVDDFTSPPAPSQPRSNASQSASNRSTPQWNKASQPAAAKTLWDLEEFTSSSSSSGHLPSSSTKTKTMETTFDSPENDFDFGSRENQDFEEHHPKQDHPWSDATTSFSNHNRVHEQAGDEDDILGLLSKPVDEVVTKQVCVCFLSPYCWLTRPLLGSNSTPRVYICKHSDYPFPSMYPIVHGSSFVPSCTTLLFLWSIQQTNKLPLDSSLPLVLIGVSISFVYYYHPNQPCLASATVLPASPHPRPINRNGLLRPQG
jgi:hypothetical protein